MVVFVSDKDTAKLYVQFFFDRNNPISEILKPCKKTHSRVLSGLKTFSFALSF